MGRAIQSPYLKGIPMQNITIGRYKPHGRTLDVGDDAVDVADHFDGWIEGVRDDGTSWIMWLDATGNPIVFFPQREEDGAVVGDPIDISRPVDITPALDASVIEGASLCGLVPPVDEQDLS